MLSLVFLLSSLIPVSTRLGSLTLLQLPPEHLSTVVATSLLLRVHPKDPGVKICLIIIIIIRLASCLVLSTLAWVRTCQTISHEMRNCKSVLGLQLGYTRLSVWTLIEA